METETTALSTGREDRGGGGVAKGGGKAFWAPPEGTMTAGTRWGVGCAGVLVKSPRSSLRQVALRLQREREEFLAQPEEAGQALQHDGHGQGHLTILPFLQLFSLFTSS